MFDGKILTTARHIHFIGIGGSGMYPIVQILHGQGAHLTGSDNNETETLAREREMGISVTLGQRAENICGADLIVYTAAIMDDNPELIAARASGVPLVERAELLGYLTSLYDDCICVCGTHGKTTTTALLTHALLAAGLDPTVFIGGKLPLIGGSGRTGTDTHMVCEACEFKDHFLQMYPDVAVILNVDADHLEYFGSLANIIRSFHRFAERATRAIVYNGDDPNTCAAIAGITGKELISFGWGSTNDYYPQKLVFSGAQCTFDLCCHGRVLAQPTLRVPGRHNVLNAVAAFAAATTTGAPIGGIADGIAGFTGVGRRFEILGEVRGVTIADDYAHHPAELLATLTAAKELPFRRVWAVFQPFTYSRTKILMDDFARSLAVADEVVMSEIMGSREKNTDGVYTRQLAAKIPRSVWFDTFAEMADYVMTRARPGDLVITLGCGDVDKCARLMLQL